VVVGDGEAISHHVWVKDLMAASGAATENPKMPPNNNDGPKAVMGGRKQRLVDRQGYGKEETDDKGAAQLMSDL
jgi:hypothetical protein